MNHIVLMVFSLVLILYLQLDDKQQKTVMNPQ